MSEKVNLREGVTLLRHGDDAAGRTVVKVMGGFYDDAMALHFTDGSVLVIAGIGNCDNGETYGNEHHVSAELHVFDAYRLADLQPEAIALLDVATDEEIVRIKTARRNARDEKDRATYERLKQRFGTEG